MWKDSPYPIDVPSSIRALLLLVALIGPPHDLFGQPATDGERSVAVYPATFPYRIAGRKMTPEKRSIEDAWVSVHGIEERLVDADLGVPPVVLAIAIRVGKDKRPRLVRKSA